MPLSEESQAQSYERWAVLCVVKLVLVIALAVLLQFYHHLMHYLGVCIEQILNK
jgi:hypothetical protein